MSTVKADKVISVHYTLTNEQGNVLDTSRDEDPLPYLHGHGNIVPGLEAGLEGQKVGYRGDISVTPEQGYGDRNGVDPQSVPRDAFPPDFELEEGMQFVVENDEGEHIPVWCVGTADDHVLLDSNHPLAGENLHFNVEIIAIRDATAEELEHGHPHGLNGDEHDHEHEHDHDHDH